MAERRRRQILAAAGPFFAARGYRQADVQDLADEIGVGKGTVYRYFPTKEELFFAVVDDGIQALSDAVDRAIEEWEGTLDQIRLGVEAYLEFFDRRPEMVELLIIERAEFRDREKTVYFLYRDRHQARREEMLQRAMDAGVLRRMPPARLTNVIGDMLYGVIFTNHFAGRRVPFREQANEILDVLMGGILADGALKQGRKETS